MTFVADPDRALRPPTDEPFLALVENQFAIAAIEQLAQPEPEGGAPVRCVYLHGPAGSGKSHLCRYLLWHESQRPEAIRQLHVTAAGWVARVDEALAAANMPALRETCLQLELLVCEDLAGLERKRETQRLVIAAIDETLARGGRVLLTGSKSPGELDKVDARLVNRLHGGACVGIGMPGTGSRAELLGHFAKLRHLALPAEMRQFLAEHLAVSPRELRAAVARLDEMAHQSGTAIVNRPLAEAYLSQVVAPPAPGLPEIAKAVAAQFEISAATLRSGGRSAATALPRHVAMSLARELTGQSLERIAAYFGRQNHGTVIHARKRLASRVETDALLRHQILQIRRRLGQPG